jgi:hypothetical protein
LKLSYCPRNEIVPAAVKRELGGNQLFIPVITYLNPCDVVRHRRFPDVFELQVTVAKEAHYFLSGHRWRRAFKQSVRETT